MYLALWYHGGKKINQPNENSVKIPNLYFIHLHYTTKKRHIRQMPTIHVRIVYELL